MSYMIYLESESEVAQSRSALCDPMDCSLPGSSSHGIFQARVLEWGATILLSKPIQTYSDESQNIVNIWVMGYWGAGKILLLGLNNKNVMELYIHLGSVLFLVGMSYFNILNYTLKSRKSNGLEAKT